jgi:hypothetical protein
MNPKITATIGCAVALCLFSQAIPAQGQISVKGATNGTIGPKSTIEPPLERVLHRSAPMSWSQPFVPARPVKASIAEVINTGRVRPGLVSWRPDFAAACRASAESGKPVLLFQMMGKLDKEFC